MNSPRVFQSLSALLILFLLFSCSNGPRANQTDSSAPAEDNSLEAEVSNKRVVIGAERLITEKFNRVQNKKVAIVANHTSLVFGETHLVDTLHNRGVDIRRVFAPEHGFRGDHDAGARVSHGKDAKTGIQLTSLYGKNKKPSAEQLKGLDVVLFDIQDVGARFYTYISTMSYVMEACAEQGIPVIVLDRPNPNGWYVEGPVLKDKYKSFIGLHNVPTVHGMTVGEYAQMVNGEGWLKGGGKCILEVIKATYYTHDMRWKDTGLPWVAPSPNLPTEYSAYLYPMTCWFEGMAVSVGRGTDHPFEQFGTPWHEGYAYQLKRDSVMEHPTPSKVSFYGLEMEYTSFTPVSVPSKATHPKFEDKECYGARFLNRVDGKSLFMAGISLLKNFEEEKINVSLGVPLYRPSFNLLMGNNVIKEQAKKQLTDQEIYDSWQDDLNQFKVIRNKYLLYPN